MGLPTRAPSLSTLALWTFCICVVVIPGYQVLRHTWATTSWSLSTAPERGPTGDGSKHLVVASHYRQNVSWMVDVPTDWSIKRYMLSEPEPGQEETGLPVPRRFGREAMAYLTYIIENYDNLPSYAAFVHGHRTTWHQQAPLPALLRALNLTALDEEDYISFRCEDMLGCERIPFIDFSMPPNFAGEKMLVPFWKHVLPEIPMPTSVAFKCCGQFAVTPRAIQTLTKDQWIRVRDPLLHADEPGQPDWAQTPGVTNEYILGTFYEKLWHVLLGAGSIYCPSVEHCRQVHFRNAVICSNDQDTTVLEGDKFWREEGHCRTIFDDVPIDQEPNWEKWWLGMPRDLGALKLERIAKWRGVEERLKEAEAEIARLKGDAPGGVAG